MGDNSSVEIANYYLHHLLDLKIITQCSKDIILYRRFIDDGFIITREPKDVIKVITSLLNTIGLKLNDDIQINPKIVNFLDIYISRNRYKVITSLYQKKMNNFLYLPFSSNHPRHTLTGWITGELIRIRRCSTLRKDFEISKLIFYDRLIKRCYPRFILDPVFSKTNFTASTIIKTKQEAISLVLPYGIRDLTPIKSVIKKFKHLFLRHIGLELRVTWSVSHSLSIALNRHTKLSLPVIDKQDI
jgi:hypothetical protein